MNLNELNINDYAKVLEVKGDDKDRQHLLDMGLIPGVEMKVIKRAPLGDPTEIRLHGYELAIRNSSAENIIVKKIKKAITHVYNGNDECLDFQEISVKSGALKPDELYSFTKKHNCSLCGKACIHNPNVHTNYKNSLAHTEKSIKDELISETMHPGFGEAGKFHNKNNENPLPDSKTICFALAGNQNSGKTTLFNALTGSSQHVGNFPGVTIDKKDGQILGRKNTKITDLPGIYSLSPYSSEELVTRDFILNDDVDCIINIIDATNLERSLYLTMQLLLLEHPVVVALNMMDELTKNNSSILVNRLEYALGVPVVPISATKNEGIDELVDHALHIAKYQELPLHQDFCTADDRGGSVHRALHSIMHIIENHCKNAAYNPILNNLDKENNDINLIRNRLKKDWVEKNIKAIDHKYIIPVRFAAEKLAENDKLVFESLNMEQNDIDAIEHITLRMEEECKMDRAACISDMRYRYILRIAKLCIVKGKSDQQRKQTEKADRILTGKWTGIPSFVIIMCLVFYLTFGVIGKAFQNLIDICVSMLSDVSVDALNQIGTNEIAVSFVKNAIFGGIGSILGFLPIIAVLFFFLSILEDSGYMARVAFVMDKLLRKIGLSGRSIVPMLIGFGCSVPAVMATRTLPSERDRKLTILMIPFMSCSAKLPVYAFISSVVFPSYSVLCMFCLYFGGILLGILMALVFKGKTKPVPFIMELPNYRMPSVKNVGHLLWDKVKDFIQRAFTVILIATVIIWFLQSFTWTLNYVDNAQNSMLSQIAGFISPIFNPIGLGDWRLITSLISGFMAKESIVATISVLFAQSNITLVLNPLVACSFLIFVLLYTPCIAAITSIKRELGFRWAIFIMFFQFVVAWFVAFIVFQIFSIMSI